MSPPPAASVTSADRLASAESVLLRAIETGVFPGCSVHVSVRGETLWRAAYGALEPDSADRATPETVYDLASLTKPLACASSVMVLLERGEVVLTDEAARFFAGPLPHLRGVTLSHLLTHTSGLPPWDRLYGHDRGPDDIVQSVLQIPLEARPGERYAYSDLGYILLGEIVRRTAGRPLDEFARDEVFRPLGMETAGYAYEEGGGKRFNTVRSLTEGRSAPAMAPTRCCPLREGQTLAGEVHDANCFALGGVSGHAGLFGTADDVAAYVRMLLSGGRARDGGRFFSPAAVRLITISQIDPVIGGQSIGWFTPPNGMHTGGDLWARAGFSHSGFTGTSAFGDPETGVAVVLLTNAVYFSTGEHLRVRRRFHNALAAACLGEGEEGPL